MPERVLGTVRREQRPDESCADGSSAQGHSHDRGAGGQGDQRKQAEEEDECPDEAEPKAARTEHCLCSLAFGQDWVVFSGETEWWVFVGEAEEVARDSMFPTDKADDHLMQPRWKSAIEKYRHLAD